MSKLDYTVDRFHFSNHTDQWCKEYKFVLGLSNDMIGYIIPKSQWDQEPPYTYGAENAPYGEINSVGPETGPIIYEQLKEIILNLDGVKE